MIAEHLDASFEIKLLGETGIFEGYASVFHVTDSVNDVIAPGAFAKTLAAWKQDGRMPPLLWQHDMKEPIGAWREIFEDSHGLFVRGELFVNDIVRAREAYKLLRENVVTGLSIGYRVLESHRDQKSGSRVLTDVELREVSMVTMPANDHVRVARVKSFFNSGEAPSEREFEAFLREAGLSRKQTKGVVAQGYKALKTYDPRDADDEIESAIVALSEKIMTTDNIRSALYDMGRSFEAFKEGNDQRLKEIERKGSADPLTEMKVNRLNADMQRAMDAADAAKKRSARWTKAAVSPPSGRTCHPSL